MFPSDEVSAERDRLFVRLRRFATALHSELTEKGHWFDGSCPATGCCLFGERGGCTWNELDGLTQLLRYNHLPAGCCGIVLHPVSQPYVRFPTVADRLFSALLRLPPGRSGKSERIP